MKHIRFLFPALLISLFGCRSASDYNQILEDIQENLDFGNISLVVQTVDSLKKSDIKNIGFMHVADSLEQIAKRIGLDFSKTETQVNNQIGKILGPFSKEDRLKWEKEGWLEWRMIDGEKKYFKRAASNLRLLKMFHEQNQERLLEIASEPEMIFRLKHTEQIIKTSENQSKPVVPVKMKITYTVTVHPDAVPDGEKIRCWMPWPKKSYQRQTEINLLSTSNPDYCSRHGYSQHSLYGRISEKRSSNNFSDFF